MSLFGNQSTSDFKRKYTEVMNLVTNYSFGTSKLSDSTTQLKIYVAFQELKEIGNRFNSPFSEYFTVYLTSVIGERISIAEALLIVHRVIELASKNQKINLGVSEDLIRYARSEVINSYGQSKVKEILNSL